MPTGALSLVGDAVRPVESYRRLVTIMETKTVSFWVPGGTRAAGLARRSILSVEAGLPDSVRHRLALLLSRARHERDPARRRRRARDDPGSDRLLLREDPRRGLRPGRQRARPAQPPRAAGRLRPPAGRPARPRLGSRERRGRRQPRLVRAPARPHRPHLDGPQSTSGAAILRPRAAVAQLARASACHAEGRGFESLQPLSGSGSTEPQTVSRRCC